MAGRHLSCPDAGAGWKYIAMSTIDDENVLISYYSTGIPPSLMHRIMSMDTIPTTIGDWYKKARDCADEIAKRNIKPSHSYQTFFPSPSKSCDPQHDGCRRLQNLQTYPRRMKTMPGKGTLLSLQKIRSPQQCLPHLSLRTKETRRQKSAAS